MDMDMSEERKVIINLICPASVSVSLSQLVVYKDERVDLGSISTMFGLDPLTIKINGHFISRGDDYIASSVTWNSLFSFFSARGRPTGISASHPLTVDGKVGTKRPHDSAAIENTTNCTSVWRNVKPLDNASNFFKKSRFMGSGHIDEFSKYEGTGLKREHNLDVDCPRKKSKIHESDPKSYVCTSKETKSNKCDGSGFKRKYQVDALRPLKKTRIHELT